MATLQPTRLQVYFIDNDDYFFHHASGQPLEVDSDAENNDERSIFFVRGVVETVRNCAGTPKLFIAPAGFRHLCLCISRAYTAMTQLSEQARWYIRSITSHLKASSTSALPTNSHSKGFTDEQLKQVTDAQGHIDYIKLNKIAIDFADAIIDSTPETPAELIEYARESGKPFMTYEQAQEGVAAYFDFIKHSDKEYRTHSAHEISQSSYSSGACSTGPGLCCLRRRESPIGGSLTGENVEIIIDSSFTVSGTTYRVASVTPKTTHLLIGNISVPGYGNLSSEVVTQFLPSTMLDTADFSAANIDSMTLNMSYLPTDFIGDSVAPLGITVYPLTKLLPNNITSAFNPDGYYDRKALGSQVYNASTIDDPATAKRISHRFGKIPCRAWSQDFQRFHRKSRQLCHRTSFF